ncbi:vomeronasal type-2 receptor 1-like [Acomys russatus]|uniref:vomeronasal type-2 receptor 1-like n=1 Tax=Acomys russatus TaxID=60746 RepID=UPI0021E31DDC|nr:vomeronasal type-2 receptor 1-like [Acomys russatus]
MASRKICLALGFLAFLLAELDAQNKPKKQCRLMAKFNLTGYVDAKNHSLVIAGLFPIHSRIIPVDESILEPVSPMCEGFNFRGFRWMKTMIHTIKEINERTDILPNHTLGYQIFDSCYTNSKAMESAMVILTGQEEFQPNLRNSTGSVLAGMVGAGGSSLSVVTSRILDFHVPQVGYTSSSSLLSDTNQFLTFLRVVASDTMQSEAMVSLIKHFGWVWVGAIAADDDYGKYGVKAFKEKMESANLCVAFSETIPKIYSNEKMQKAVKAIKSSTAKVIVLFTSDIDLSPFVLEMVHHNITDRTWIASEAWITSALIAKPEYFPYFGGAIGFAIPRSVIPGLKEFLYDIHPSKDPTDVLTTEFWQTAFNCTWPNSSVPYNVDHRVNMTGKEDRLYDMSDQLCTGEEKLEDLKNTYLDVSQLRITNNVKQAVYVFAHALDKLSRCQKGKGPIYPHGDCPRIPDFNFFQLMHFMKEIKFKTHDEKWIALDDKGDLKFGHYDILNWQLDDNGEISFVNVGRFSFRRNMFELYIPKNSTIFWNTESSKLPHSVCTDVCPPGTRKVTQEGQPICCFDCLPCADGYVSEKPGQTECDPCGEDDWSNAQKSKCVPKEVEFLAYEEALGFTLVILSIIGALVILAVTVVYVIYRHTPLVNANDRELSFLIQVSLVITVLSSMLFIGKPQHWTCMARQVTLALGFCLCLSSILGKTISLFFAYRISKSKTRLISMHPIFRKLIVVICVAGEIGACAAYLVLEPPRMLKNIEIQNVKIIFECSEGSIEFLCSIFGFDVLLALLCFLTTFVARQLPDNYYEGKCITFGMLAFFIVWISFVPAYLSTKGKLKVAVEILVILASSYSLLGCIFLPKCFIILLRPKRNTDETVGGRVPTVDRSIQLTSASVSSELNSTTVSTILDE